MTEEKILKRINMCVKNNLCFISLEGLENELFISTIDFNVQTKLVIPVKVKAEYIRY